MSKISSKRWMHCLWIAFVARGIFYASVTPLWEGFDEHVHFAYVQQIAERGSLPRQGRDRVSQEVQISLRSVPLPWQLRDEGIGITHEQYWTLGPQQRHQLESNLRHLGLPLRDQPAEGASGYLTVYQAQHGPLYYLLAWVPYRFAYPFSLFERVFAIRFFSVLIASLVVPLTFWSALRVFREGSLALALAATVAFMPGLMIDVARVGNDGLGVALFSALIALACRTGPVHFRDVLVLGLLAGLGLLTKAYFLTALPALGFVLFFRTRTTGMKAGDWLRRFAALLAVALAASGWWYARNYVTTGSWSGLQQDVATLGRPGWTLLSEVGRIDWVQVTDVLTTSYIWIGNWSFLGIRSWMYHLAGNLLLLGLLGTAVRVISRSVRRTWDDAFDHVALLLSFYVCFFVGLAYHVVISSASSGQATSGGWYLYAVVVAEVILVVYGLATLAPRHWNRRVTALPVIVFALLDLYGMFFVLLPYYTGFTAHKPDGGGPGSFKPHLLSSTDYGTIIARLTANKPALLTTDYFIVSTVLFLLISLVAIAAAVRVVLKVEPAP